jgi:hypothetical protein
MLVVAGGDPAKVFQSVDESFHYVPEFVEFGIMPSISVAFAGGNDWTGSLGTDRSAKRIAVISFVGDDVLSSDSTHQCLGFIHVMALTAGQAKVYRPAITVDGDMNFGAEAPAGPPQRLSFLPPFPPAAC